MTALHWIDHLFAFALCVIAPIYALRKGKVHILPEEVNFRVKKFIYRTNSLFLWAIAAIALLIWYFLQRPWDALGFQWPLFTNNQQLYGAIAVGIAFVFAYLIDVWTSIGSAAAKQKSREHWMQAAPFMPANWAEWRQFAVLAFSAAAAEEIIFRAYLIYYFEQFFNRAQGGIVLSLLIPALAFSLVHIYQGGKSVGKIFFFALGFGALYMLTQSLLWPVLIHLLVDLLGGYLTMKLFQDEPKN